MEPEALGSMINGKIIGILLEDWWEYMHTIFYLAPYKIMIGHAEEKS